MELVCIGCHKLYTLIQGRARFQLYQKLLALAAAVIQAVGQLTYIRPFVSEWDATWLAVNSLTLVAGAMVLVHVCSAPTTLFSWMCAHAPVHQSVLLTVLSRKSPEVLQPVRLAFFVALSMQAADKLVSHHRA